MRMQMLAYPSQIRAQHCLREAALIPTNLQSAFVVKQLRYGISVKDSMRSLQASDASTPRSDAHRAQRRRVLPSRACKRTQPSHMARPRRRTLRLSTRWRMRRLSPRTPSTSPVSPTRRASRGSARAALSSPTQTRVQMWTGMRRRFCTFTGRTAETSHAHFRKVHSVHLTECTF